ncbi:MAG: T9SS type A sorting domain-containing protein [Segetibacter sp.]
MTSLRSAAEAVQPKEGVQSLEFDARAYPNPTTSSFTIKVSGNNRKELISMTVTDVNGRVIEKRNNLTAGPTLQIGSGYRPGIYFLQMLQGKARTQVKLLKAVY